VTRITVIRDRRVPGWPKYEHGERAYVLPLGAALMREYSTDAHFTQYVTPIRRRLNGDALEQLEGVELGVIVFDIDCPAVHGTSEPAPQEWRDDLRSKLEALAQVHADPFVYFTRGGARVVFAQSTPTVLRARDDAQKWRREYAITLAYFERRFGLVFDAACADWTRLFRLPRVVREGGRREQWPILGDETRIGALLIDATAEDIALARSRSKAFDKARVRDLAPSSTSDGYGLLFHALNARGDIGREHGSGAFLVRCPNEAQHSCGVTGDGSTVLYLPASSEEIGAIHCLHGHCANNRVRDWLRLFSDAELEQARRRAGITSRTRAA
jgi:hypothetical protein